MKKRLYRSGKSKMLAGVCGGIAEYFDIDPTLVRLAWVLFTCLGGSGLLAYIVCAIIIPQNPETIVDAY
ncbi:MAG: PspC domain-containing protein [Firmicutes bacterium]|nr:PspC domain-containing protein [Bacillota bacterium]